MNGVSGQRGPRVLVVQPAPSDPVGRLGEWLTDAGLELVTADGSALVDVAGGSAKHDQQTDLVEYRPKSSLDHASTLGEDARALDGYAGLVVVGGPQSANDAELEPVRQLLRDAVSAELPTLTICLGAQLLAAAHGGRVEPNPDGPELGAQLIAKRAAAATDPLFGPLPITPDVVQWHFDAVTALPAGAIQLASSPGCEQQAFRLGRLAWGLQFHIETTPDVVRRWAEKDAPRLADYDLDSIVSRTDRIHDDLAEVWRPFTDAFAGVVREPAGVPAARGVRTSTAAPVTDPAAIRAALAAELHATRSSLPTPGPRPDD